MAHEHTHSRARRSHARTDFNNAFVIGIALNAAYVLFEAIFGLIAHSLALVADGGHNLSDVLGLLLGLGSEHDREESPDETQNLWIALQLDTCRVVQCDFPARLSRRDYMGSIASFQKPCGGRRAP